MSQQSDIVSQRTTDRQKHRHVPMIVAGLLYIGSVIVSLILQDWGNLVIAPILVVLSAVPLCTERWVGLKLPLNIQIQYGLLILAGPYLGGYWGLYVAWPPWDTWVHFYSGIFISLALIVALGKRACCTVR